MIGESIYSTPITCHITYGTVYFNTTTFSKIRKYTKSAFKQRGVIRRTQTTQTIFSEIVKRNIINIFIDLLNFLQVRYVFYNQ